MKNQWKKLAVIAGCSILMAGQIFLPAHAEEATAQQPAAQEEAKAAALKAPENVKWEGQSFSFYNPNENENVAFLFEIYVDGQLQKEDIVNSGIFYPKGNVINDCSKYFKEFGYGDYTYRVKAVTPNGPSPSDWSSMSEVNSYRAEDARLPQPVVIAETDGTVKVSLPNNSYVLGTDYQLEYILYFEGTDGTRIQLDSIVSNDSSYQFNIKNGKHVVSVKAKSLKPDLKDSDVVGPVEFNSQAQGGSSDNSSSSNSYSGSSSSCSHDYKWETVTSATATEDAMEAYTCKYCGHVKEYMKASNSAYAQFNKDAISAISKAAANETVTLKTNMWVSFCDSVINTLGTRPDVTLTVNYFYMGTRYSMTIPAGADLSKLQASEGYYGFRYLDGFFPAQIEN